MEPFNAGNDEEGRPVKICSALFSKTFLLEAKGELLGSGGSREVYECKLNPKWVVKIAKNLRKRVANKREWRVWEELRNTEDARYLAPCVAMAMDGSWLLQMRAVPTKRVFKNGPVHRWMKDMPAANHGIFCGQLVLVDYDHPEILERVQRKMNKIK